MSVYSRTNNEFVALVETSGILQNMTSSNIEYVVCGDGETPTANTGIRLNPSKKLKFAVLDGMTAYVRVVGNTTGDIIVIQNDSSKLFIYKGSKANFSDLPLTGNRIGDTWNIINADEKNGIRAGDNVSWNGTEWDILAGVVDLSGYVEKVMIFRKDKTAYSVGDTSTLAGITAGYFLECTTAGVTGATAPVITPPVTAGQTIIDGTVVWKVRKCFPTSGGALTGTSLTWNKNDLGGSAIVAKSLGTTTSYIKRASGEIIQTGWVGITANVTSATWTFPVSFSSDSSYVVMATTTGTTPIALSVSYVDKTKVTIHAPSANYMRIVAVVAIGS